MLAPPPSIVLATLRVRRERRDGRIRTVNIVTTTDGIAVGSGGLLVTRGWHSITAIAIRAGRGTRNGFVNVEADLLAETASHVHVAIGIIQSQTGTVASHLHGVGGG